jgi:predicted DNA-binding transcriptional regulator AlpA
VNHPLPALSTPQAAKRLGLTFWSLYNLVYRGHLEEPVKIGNCWAWYPADLRRAKKALRARKGAAHAG